ncbi:MAG TPA: NERD domain-containing protein [Pseudogracilibacillus sp.]|nr:NERD domain-containing protein [Pseudogracilibacillus sp.]
MAQLVKLADYISRYEINPFHYPTQYIRLKRENWQQLQLMWKNENELEQTTAEENGFERDGRSWIPFARKREEREETDTFERHLPQTREGLTRYFLNELYPFQLKWATSTISQISFIDPKFEHDYMLKQLLQRLPDIYLLMYYPVFSIRKAPIDSEIILISPIGVEIISIIETSSEATVYVGDDRTWNVEIYGDVKRIISPTIALKRTEQIVKSILRKMRINFPVQKTVISDRAPILYVEEPYNIQVVGKHQFDEWIQDKRQLSAPLKNEQLRAIEALLTYCQSTSVKRPEWVDEDESLASLQFEEKQ